MPGSGLDIKDGALVLPKDGQVAKELALNDAEAPRDLQTFVAPELRHRFLFPFHEACEVLLSLAHLSHPAHVTSAPEIIG